MVWSPPTVNDFVTRFPEFEDHDEDHIEVVLQESINEVGSTWIEADKYEAVLYRTAHFVSMGGGAISSDTGQPIDAETGAYIKSRTVGDVSTSFGKEGASTSSKGTGGSSGSSMYGATVYGQWYQVLLNRSHPLVLVV